MPMHARHAMDRERMHGKHMAEHAAHDHGKKGDKSDMHERHHAEMKSLRRSHEKEFKAGASQGGSAKPHKKEAEMPKGEKKAETTKAGEKGSEKK